MLKKKRVGQVELLSALSSHLARESNDHISTDCVNNNCSIKRAEEKKMLQKLIVAH